MRFPVITAVVALLLDQTFGSTIQKGLLESLENGNTKDIIVTFDGTADVLSSTMFTADTSRRQRAQTVMHVLEDKAASTQYTTLDLLKNFNDIEVTSFWISNTLHIKGATSEVVRALAKHNGANHVREATVIHLEEPKESTQNIPTVLGNEWGIAKVQAPEVWKRGFTGENVVVATIDTGVRGTHEALRGNFRKINGWYDPYDNSSSPMDPNGHGTHTMGTICGQNGIGVAPGATWIACRGCGSSSCTEEGLLKCAQFISCPHDGQEKNFDCSLAPHVVSNSWGGGRADMFYKAATDAWTKAGIIPVFANGNEGPSCDTASSPADYPNVIAVGSTTSSDAISSFSSKGPAATHLIKPDISAPGSDIRSSYKNSDTSYSTLSGTSMATPHVAGVVALLLSSSRSGFSYPEVYQRLTSSTDRDLMNGQVCGPQNSAFPNNVFGHGRINALKAIDAETPPTVTSPPATSSPPATRTPKPTTPKPTPVQCEFIWTGFLPDCIPGHLCEMDWQNLECRPKRI